MRKKIATLLLAFVFIFPCALIFTACGDDDEDKIVGISVELINNDYTMTNNTITIPYGSKIELDDADFKVTAEKENGDTSVIQKKTETQDGYTFTSTIPSDNITPLGEYKISFSHVEVEDAYEIDVNVVKADVDMSGVEWNYISAFTYDKTEKEVQVTGLPSGVTVDYQGTTNATNAGEYTATAIFTYSDTVNYNAIPNMVLNWEIEKADIVISSVTTQSFTYDGTVKTATITSNLPANVEATITGETTATDAGTYDIVVSFEYTGADSANYNEIEDLNCQWTINPTKFTNVGTVTLSQDYNLVYTGTEQSVVLDLTGLDTDNVEVVGITGLSATNAGSYDAVVELRYIGSSTNYNSVDNVIVEWEIAKAPLTITAKDATITYGDNAINDGVNYGVFANGETASVLNGSIQYDYDGYVVGSNVGQYDINISGVSADNYEISFISGTLTVEKKALTIKANDATIDYNADAVNNGVEPIGLIPSDTVSELGTLQYNYGGYVTGSNVGSYDITVSGLDETNYDITYIQGTLTVEKIDVNVDVAGIALIDNALTYTGAELTVEVDESTLPQGVSVTNIIIRDKTPINVDTYVAVIYLQYFDTTNYNAMAEIEREWTIEKATVGSFDNVSISALELTYNGLEQEVEVLNIPTGAEIDTITGNKGTNVDEYTVEVSFVCADTDNYNSFEAVTKEFTWNITCATLTITANDNQISYGQEASDNGYVVSGLVNNETESVLVGTIAYSYNYNLGDNVGTYDITPYGVTANNYAINFVNGTLTVEKAIIDFANVDWVKASTYAYSGEVIKPTLNSGADNIQITYSYKQNGDDIEPINVGTYVAHAEIELTNNNYEIINYNVVDYEYEIVAQEVDCSAIAWTTTLESTYNGEAFKPEVVNLPEGIVATYSYFANNGVSIGSTQVDNPIDAGNYIAYVEINAENANYVISNYRELSPVEFVINKAEIDVTGLDWATTASEFDYSATAITPVLNKSIDNVEITYIYTQKQWVDNGDGLEEVDVEVSPINAGEYKATATLVFDERNYALMDNGVEVGFNQLLKTYNINPIKATLGNVEWNIATVLSGSGDFAEYHYSTVEYTGNAIEISIQGDYDMFDVAYQLDWQNVDDISITSVGSYSIFATFTLKESYSQNYTFDGYTLELSLNVTANPFESIEIDGEAISYSDFANQNYFEYGAEITFTLKDGFTAYGNSENEISSIIISEEGASLIIRDGENNEIFSKYDFSYYYMDEIVVGTETIENLCSTSTEILLGKGQTSFNINFDEKYLTKYASQLTFEIWYEEGEPSRGVISQVPFVVDDATNVNYLYIYLGSDESTRMNLLSIDVLQFSPIKEVTLTIVRFDDSEGTYTQTLTLSQLNDCSLSNAILVDINTTLLQGYENCTVKYYLDDEYTNEVDLTNISNLDRIYVVVYDGENAIETKEVYTNYNFYANNGTWFYPNNNNYRFNVSENTFAIEVNVNNEDLVVTSLINGNESLTLSEDITSTTFTLSVVYDGVTYTYSVPIIIVKSLNVADCLNEDALYNGAYLTNSSNGREYYINTYYNALSLYEYFDASNIKEFEQELDDLEFPVVEGYIVSNKELVVKDGDVYLKLTISSDAQTYDLTNSSYDIYILLEFSGSYDSDTSAEIKVFNTINGSTIIDNNTTTISIDISTESLDITLNNNYATAVITDNEQNILKKTEYGYLPGNYNFTATGTYYLVIMATDGTTKTYTINVTGEIIPILEVVVGDITLTQTMGQYGPTEGDFNWKQQTETELSFTALLGSDAQSQISENKVNITSVRSSMLATAILYDQSGVEIANPENFVLTVQGDANNPFVMFYAVATVQGFTSTTYIYLYLCDELPAQKAIEVVYGETTLTTVIDTENGMTSGDLEMNMLSQTEMLFIGYLGAFEEPIPQTITLDSIYCIYSGNMVDNISSTPFTNLTNVVLQVGNIENDSVPCVSYSIVMEIESITITINVVLYLADKSEVAYPVTVQIGENSLNFKCNIMSMDFGDFTMDMTNGFLYATLDSTVQTVNSVSITLSKAYTDYSYMVLIGDAYVNYVQHVEDNQVYNSEYIEALIQVGTQAFKATENNLTMNIPITFVDGLAYFDIAVEGFVGYIPEGNQYGVSFVRVYLVIEGIGELPSGDGSVSVVGYDVSFTIEGKQVNSRENESFNDEFGNIYIASQMNYTNLVENGVIVNNMLTLEAVTNNTSLYLFTKVYDEENQQTLYNQVINGGYLYLNIENHNNYGVVASVLLYETLEVDNNTHPVSTIYILFADGDGEVAEGTVVLGVMCGELELTLSEDMSGTISMDMENQCYYAYLGADAYVDGATEFTLDAFYMIQTTSVTDAFNAENVITLTDDMASNITLTIGEHNGMKCVAIEMMEGVNLYLYLADALQG